MKMSKKLARQLLLVPTAILDEHDKVIRVEYEGDEFVPIGTFRHATSIAEANGDKVAKILGALIQAEAHRVLAKKKVNK